jgi:hypothetical protein
MKDDNLSDKKPAASPPRRESEIPDQEAPDSEIDGVTRTQIEHEAISSEDISASGPSAAPAVGIASAAVMEVLDDSPSTSSDDMPSEKGSAAAAAVLARESREQQKIETLFAEMTSAAPPTINSRLNIDDAVKHSARSSSAGETDTQPGAVAVAGMGDAADQPTPEMELNTAAEPENRLTFPEREMAENSAYGSSIQRERTPSPVENQSSRLPVAEEYHEATDFHAISAVVSPNLPSESAMFHVDMDPVSISDHPQYIEPLEIQRATPETEKKKKRIRKIAFMVVGFLFIVILTSTVTAVVVQRKGSRNEAGEIDSLSPIDASEPTTAPTFPYPCFNSTLDVFTSQYLNPDKAILIMCPNTTIKIGTFRNPSRNDFNITGGDFPIQLFRRNITVQCGLDGRRSNNCVLDSGLIHVVAQNLHWHPDFGFLDPDPDADNFVIRGMTFTGTIQGTGQFGGIPAAISHPGKNIVLDDCAWVDITGTKRIFVVGTNYLMKLQGLTVPDMVTEVTIQNCLFDDVLFEEEFLVSFNQAVHIKNTTFRNIRLPDLLPPGECDVHPNGCRNLLHCHDGNPTSCSIEDVCVENSDFSGAAPIVISHETNWSNGGNNTWIGPPEYTPIFVPLCQENCTFDQLNFCDYNIALLDGEKNSEGWASYTCIEPAVFERRTGACPV